MAASSTSVIMVSAAVATRTHPASTSSLPRPRYWRKANTLLNTGPAGREFWIEYPARLIPAMVRMGRRRRPAIRSRRWRAAKAVMEIASTQAAQASQGRRRWLRELVAPDNSSPLPYTTYRP
jgi:hypothetical protein